MADAATDTLISRFQFTTLLNTDQQGRRIILQGTIDDKLALLLAERAAFSTAHAFLASFARLISRIQILGENDIYRWYLAHFQGTPHGGHSSSSSNTPSDALTPPDLKINLIYPATDKHLRKYALSQTRVVVETADIYARYVRAYMQQGREEGRLNWVWNILDGEREQENVLYRSASSTAAAAKPTEDDFLLLPDLNWDRETLGALHLLALVVRRDIWSVRDLKKRDVGWLKHLQRTVAEATTRLYPCVEGDMLKSYVHYQPTYYHFHVHVVHVNLDATATQAVGKALGLDYIITQLENLEGGDEAGMDRYDLSYTIGESSELWQQVYLPLKEGRKPKIGG